MDILICLLFIPVIFCIVKWPEVFFVGFFLYCIYLLLSFFVTYISWDTNTPYTPSGKSTEEVLYPKDHNFSNELLKKANELR